MRGYEKVLMTYFQNFYFDEQSEYWFWQVGRDKKFAVPSYMVVVTYLVSLLKFCIETHQGQIFDKSNTFLINQNF